MKVFITKKIIKIIILTLLVSCSVKKEVSCEAYAELDKKEKKEKNEIR